MLLSSACQAKLYEKTHIKKKTSLLYYLFHRLFKFIKDWQLTVDLCVDCCCCLETQYCSFRSASVEQLLCIFSAFSFCRYQCWGSLLGSLNHQKCLQTFKRSHQRVCFSERWGERTWHLCFFVCFLKNSKNKTESILLWLLSQWFFNSWMSS